MGIRIDGKAVSAAFREKLKEDVARLTEQGMQPGLAVVIVGDDQASRVYVNNKKKACQQLGIYSEEYALSGEITEEELLELVNRLNNRSQIHGILVQLPCPGISGRRWCWRRLTPGRMWTPSIPRMWDGS